MRIFLIASTVFLVTGSPYGPPPNENEVFPTKANTACTSIDGCGSESNVHLSASKFSSDGNRFPHEVNEKSTRGRPYWWEGQNNPFKGGCNPGTAGCPSPSNTPGKVLLPSSSASNKVVNSFTTSVSANQGGSQCVCPSSFACVHWQFCQDGVMIVDGSGSFDHSSIPAQVSSAFGSCGRNMICCRIPTCEGVGQASSFQTSNKFSSLNQHQNVHTSHFSKIEPQSEVDSQSTIGFGVHQDQQGPNKFSQTHTNLPAFGSPAEQKEPHFTELSLESKKTISSPHDSIKGDHSVQSGTFHSSPKIPGIQEVPSEFAIFTQTPKPERVEPELDLDDLSAYLPPSTAFQTGQSQLQVNVNHNQQQLLNEHQQKPDATKFSKPSLPEQGTKFTSPSLVNHRKPDQTAHNSETLHQTKQPLKPIDKDEERLPSHFSGRPDQNKYHEEDSTGSFNANLPITPQLTKPVKPAQGDSHVFTPQVDSGSAGHISLKFPTSPSRPGSTFQSQSHKLGESQDQASTFISGQVGPTKETKFQGSQYKPDALAQQPDQDDNAGNFGTSQVEKVHSTFTSGQPEKTKVPKVPTSQYQPDQPTHLGSLEFQGGQHSQSNIEKLDHQVKPDHPPSVVSPAASKLTGGDTSFHTQSQQHHNTDGFGDSSFSSGTQQSQYEFGQTQGRPDSTFPSGSSGIHNQPNTHGLPSHSQISQQHTGGVFGSSSFESGNSQGRPDSIFSSGSSGIHDQPNTHGLASHSQTSQQHTGGASGSSSFVSGQQESQFQFGQSHINAGAGFHQPAVIKPQGSGVNLHGRPSSTFDRGTPSTGIVSGAGTQSSGMGGMMMMMGPMLVGGKMMLNGEVMKTISGNPLISGSCSAGQFCLPQSDCNPYNGFIILYANQQVAASFPNAPKVPLQGCHIGGISDSESFCCQLPHPLLGPDGKPFD